jgi:hypothetical protein
MAHKEKANETRVCPKTGRPINAGKYRWALWVLPLTGLVSLVWFLVRVIPKPSRATYPCQRFAAPFASGFVIWIAGLIASALAYRRAKNFLHQSRYIIAGVCIIVSVFVIWLSISLTGGTSVEAAFTPAEQANSPIGVAKGIYPGRVVWTHEPSATNWDGSTGRWWDDNNTDQGTVDLMVSKSIQTLTGEPNDTCAWDALFRHFNQINGFGDVGYQYGERVAIKINMNQDAGSTWGPAVGMPSPHVVYSFLDQLINVVGIPGSAITVYDASRYIGDPIYDKVRSNPDPNFQSVTFVVSPVVARSGRIGASHDQDKPIHTEAGIAYLPTCVTQAKYLINMALLRPHELYGITLCAKNHFGSVRFLSTSSYQGWTPSPLHNYGLRGNPMGSYNCLVELNGHRHLAGKTLLYVIDALYSASHQSGSVIKWESFGNDWCSSVFASQDPVAIDSVGLDFLRNELRCTNVTGYPENYLHEMALAENPPSGTFYDPEDDGIRLTSLGVHEHWNNALEKKYSRNLGTGQGIELVVPSLTPIVDFNSDGIVDSVDMCMMVDYWGTDEPLYDIAPPPFGDGIVDIQDLILLSEHLFEENYPPELLAYWKLDETDGFVAYNSAENSDGFIFGDPVWRPTEGKRGGALELDGIDDYIVSDYVLNPTVGRFSVFAWIKGGVPGQVIISQVNDNGSGETWLGTTASDGSLMTGLVPPPVGRFLPQPLESQSVITDDQWHHVGFVWEGAYRCLYVDGAEVARDTQAQTLASLKSSNGGLHIGTSKALDADSFFSGLIDDVRIYDVALTAEEIVALAQ